MGVKAWLKLERNPSMPIQLRIQYNGQDSHIQRGVRRAEAERGFGRGIMALSMDIREKVMKAIVGGMSRRQAAARFDIGPATAVRWAKRVETSGSIAPSKMGGDRRSQRIEAHADFIRAQIEEQPDLTIMELREKIRERHGVGFGYGTVWRFLARHNITRKKKTGHASEQERQDVAEAREEWFEGQLDLDPSKLVFIDETAVSTNMARRFGWAPRG